MAILIVDDEESVLRTLERMLKRLGHTVLKALGGREAINLLNTNRGTIELAIIDVSMPEMSGIECLRALRAIEPALPIVLSSGYGHDAAGVDASEIVAFMEKPFQLAELSAMLARAIKR